MITNECMNIVKNCCLFSILKVWMPAINNCCNNLIRLEALVIIVNRKGP